MNEKFPKIEVSFTDREAMEAIVGLVKRSDSGFSEAAIYRFDELVAEGVDFAECCRVLLLNEVCYRAVVELTAKEEKRLKLNAKPDWIGIPEFIKDPHCQHCGEPCMVQTIMHFGMVSECHGVGVGYEDEHGNVVFANEDMRYDSSWND